jgi:hypothetical protein
MVRNIASERKVFFSFCVKKKVNKMGKKAEKEHDILRTYKVDPSFRGKKTTPEKLSIGASKVGSSIAKKVRQKEKRKAFLTSTFSLANSQFQD